MIRNRYIPVLIYLLIFTLLIAGCGTAPEDEVPVDPDAARNGDIVKINYTMKLDDGSLAFTSLNANEPLEITLGEGRLLPAVEKAIIGMKEGEKKTITVPAENAFGPYRQELVIEVPRYQLQLPEGKEPQLGMTFQAKQADGSVVEATVVEVSENLVKLDTNNKLAGKDLIFEMELIDIL